MPEVPIKRMIVTMCLLGEDKVGKTSLCKRFVNQEFLIDYQETPGVDFGQKEVVYKNYSIIFQIWDISGHPIYEQLRKIYFLGLPFAMIIYDVSDTKPDLYERIMYWAREFWTYNGKGNVPIVLIGNKIDLREKQIGSIPYSEGMRLAERISYEKGIEIPFIETSAKTGESVTKAFELIAELFIKRIIK